MKYRHFENLSNIILLLSGASPSSKFACLNALRENEYRIISTQSGSSVHVFRWDEFRNPAFHGQPLQHALGMHHETSVPRPGFVLKKLILGVATFESVDGSWMCMSVSSIMGSAPLTAGPERNRLGLWRKGEDLPGSLIH